MPWDPVVETEIVPIHAALVPSTPTGEVVFFEGFFGDQRGRSYAWRCAPGPGEEQVYRLNDVTDDEGGRRNLFCAGHAHLPDGRWLVVGGTQVGAEPDFILDENGQPILDDEGDPIFQHQHGHGGSGIRDTWAFLPRLGAWRRLADMNPQPDGGALRGGGRWYPTCVTLANGRVLAHGGHPIGRDADMIDDFPSPTGRRHNNNIPEVYVPGLDKWLELRDPVVEQSMKLDEYNRLHVAPTGHVFFSTLAKSVGDTRLYDPYAGKFVANGFGVHLDALYDDANCSAVTSSVLLPLLHGDPGNAWVLVAGGAAPERLNLAAQGPQWIAAGARQAFPDDPAPPKRNNLHGIMLPTGQVFFAFGVRDDTTDVDAPEIYTPAIDWATGRYETDGNGVAQAGSWDTRTSASERSQRRRGYHSCAVLQPDGSVWAAGSTHPAEGDALTDPDVSTQERSVEVYRPDYGANRPTISASPAVAGYGEPIRITMDGAAAMHRVALVRCGSFTHAFDSDQRYLTAAFSQSGASITATAPGDPNLAPPGYYLLYVLRDETTPSVQGRFLRLTHLDQYPVLQQSSYSVLEVRALTLPETGATEAVFADAIDLFFEGFLPHELNVPAETPEISFRFTTGDPDVPGMRVELAHQDFEVNPTENPDLAQRFRYVYDVIFESEAAFDTFADDQVRFIELRATLGGREIVATLTLMRRANPMMRDGDPHYLSDDLRIHKAPVADVNAVGGPQAYIQGLLDAFENSPAADESDEHPFEALDASQDANPVVLAVPQGDDGVFNFAVARVRFLSVPGEDAEGVKVFFRLFNTVGTALEWNEQTTYRTLEGTGGRIPGLGRIGSSIISIPFFAAPRVTPDEAMTAQEDNVVNRRTLFGAGPSAAYRYFGCWLDVNTETPHFPPFPQNDGPYGDGGFFEDLIEGGGPRSILEHIRGSHQCLVAEISYEDDPIQPGQTPATSDNLSQRNLATVAVANPGLETITRTAQTTVDLKPSDTRSDIILDARRRPAAATARLALRPDELVFEGADLPPGTQIELYLPDVDIGEALELSALRNGPPTLRRIDDHTVAFEIDRVAYLALPGGRTLNIAGLLSVTLPLGIVAGQVYTLSVKQYSGRTLRWVGAFDLRIPVAHGPGLLEDEIGKLAIMRYIFDAMPERDRWRPVFERYLVEIEERVRGFGGDPDRVKPSPHGSGRPGGRDDGHGEEPGGGGEPGAGGGVRCVEGKICAVEYDCFGDLEAVVVEECDAGPLRLCAGRDFERVAVAAFRDRMKVRAFWRPAKGPGGAVNATCPWSGRPVSAAATATFEGATVGFCGPEHRDRFLRILEAGTGHGHVSAAPAGTCPWSGRPILRDAIARLSSGSVGFCSRAHRDRFLHAVAYFREVIRRLDADGKPIARGAEAARRAGAAEGGVVHDHAGAGRAAARTPNAGAVNRTCPWTGRRVRPEALTTFESFVVGFHEPADRDRFEVAAAIAGAHYPPRRDAAPSARAAHGECGHGHDADEPSHLNGACPVSGRPARPDVAADVDGRSVAFCGETHRDEWNRAVAHFRDAARRVRCGCDGALVRIALVC